MGKNLIQQARGKGGPTYRAPSFRYEGKAKHVNNLNQLEGEVIDLITCQGHSAPLAKVKYSSGEVILMIAPEGLRVGQKVFSGG